MEVKGVFSHESDEWATPQWLYDELDAEFHFNYDPCATAENHKCFLWTSKEDDGLTTDWGGAESVLQSAIQRPSAVGREGISGDKERRHFGLHAHACENGHKVFLELHLAKVRGPVYQRSGALRKQRRKAHEVRESVPYHDCDLSRS